MNQYTNLFKDYVPANPSKKYQLRGFPDGPPFDTIDPTSKKWYFIGDDGKRYNCDVIVDSQKNLAKAKFDTPASACNAVPRGGMINEIPLTMPVRKEIAETLSVFMTEMRSDNTLQNIMNMYSHPDSEVCSAPSQGAVPLGVVDMTSAFMVYLFCFAFAVGGITIKHTCWMWAIQFLYLRASRSGNAAKDADFDEYLPNAGPGPAVVFGSGSGSGEVEMKSKGEKASTKSKHHEDGATTELIGAIQVLTAKLERLEARSERLEAKLDRVLGSSVGKPPDPEIPPRLLQQSSIGTPNGGLLGTC